jgi:heme-degrading monooxygenase HmoA
MFIAMNRFRVVKGSEEAFETVWLSRDSQLDTVPGFVEFRLLKGPEADDHTLYASQTVWESRTAFEAWTRSEGRPPWGRTEQAPLPRPSPIRGLRGSPDHRRSQEGERRGLRADAHSIPGRQISAGVGQRMYFGDA